MKNKSMTKGLAGLLLCGVAATAFTSCKDDYLDLEPVTSYTPEQISGSLTGAQAAMVGLCNGMYRPCDFGFNGPNGAPWLDAFYGEGMGNASIQGLWTYSSSFVNSYANWAYMNTSSSSIVSFMWEYCYNLIDAANNILAYIDDVVNEEEGTAAEFAERDYIKAAALTIRAHAYTRLLQTYAPRWADSNNGQAYCLIIRTEPTTPDNTDIDFSTMNKVLELIYTDLDDAIELFEGSSRSYSRPGIWAPNEDVARGLYARAAMLQNDYTTAIEKATDAIANYPIMSADEYRSGFIYANSEYLWAGDIDAQDLFWDTAPSWGGYNGYYTAAFGIGDSMDYDLYKNLSMTDCRKLLYFMPELMELIPYVIEELDWEQENYGDPEDYFYFVKSIEPEDFFYSIDSGGIADPSSNNIYLDGYYYSYDGEDYNNDYAYYLMDMYAWGYYKDYGLESALANYDENLGPQWGYVTPRFGSGMKFWGAGAYASNNYPFMRASELGYIIAEAQCRLGHDTEAQSMMNYLNQDVRDPYYNCTLTGEDLLAHIKAYREIELWDEGFNWFDLKRWGDPCTRNQWVEGDFNSGNWGSILRSFEPTAMNGWRYAVPESEFLYNKKADRSKLDM